MAPILTTPAQVSLASDEELLAAYQHYTGRRATRFANRAAAERQVELALMSSADARGHLGVPKDSRPQPAAHSELVRLAAETGRDDARAMAKSGLPGSQAGLTFDPSANPYPPGSLAARLWAQAEGEPAPLPLAGEDPGAQARRVASRADRAPIVSAGATGWVRIAPAPTARLQPSSVRAAVYAYISAAAHQSASIAALLVEFGPAARGCIAKLRITNHITDCPAPGTAAATQEGSAP